MKRSVLGIMVLCGALLLGCSQQSNIAEEDDSIVAYEEQDKQAIIDSLETKEDWYSLTTEEIDELFGDPLNFYRAYENKFGESYHVYADMRDEEEHQRRWEEWEEEFYANYEPKKEEPKPYDHVGFTLENFENVKIGEMTVSEVNEMFGFEGTLIGEAKGIKTYEWEDSFGSRYEYVQIVFVDGVAHIKSQSGLE
ncbi:hypothetical protein [Turicibacter sanguinis]|uniref:hypothetical protein n=1 Tax=Turicibacter sanguinis TaxID=154288 RepID=UPI00325A7C45